MTIPPAKSCAQKMDMKENDKTEKKESNWNN